METKRPVYLNLFQYRFPVTAICSVLHRITGVIMFLLLPLLLWSLDKSLSSAAGFNEIKVHGSAWLCVGLWIVMSAIIFHVLAGLRHLLMDIGLGEGLQAARASAYLVMIVSVVLIIAAGVWLW